jgi:hypothetical protein
MKKGLTIVLLICWACTPQQSASGRKSGDTLTLGGASTANVRVSASQAGTPRDSIGNSNAPLLPSKLPLSGVGRDSSHRMGPNSDRPTVRTILNEPLYVGKLVSLSGLCAEYGHLAEGGPPKTRSDWQLSQDGAAIYVTGPMPPGCLAASSPPTVTITAKVRGDTIVVNSPSTRRTRRYLEIVR